ncbi:MAG: phosphoribosylglycinamide formyltransferase [Gammaproteobacteria bacterium]|nr:phosphoribosylglycinamide formyltransferase [Gammaproteobacteria bacterium]
MDKASLVVLISGTGSNLQAIIDAIKNNELNAEISTVISNQVSAAGLERATRENITTHVIEHKRYPNREFFDQALMQVIDPLKPDLVVLAGFMRILSDNFVEHYRHRLINIHPSLLPKYKGLNTHQKAISNKDKVHGASVHYVGTELDSGPVVIQAEVPVLATDTAETLAKRVLKEEHKIYPLAIKLHIEGRVTFDDGQLKLDGQQLTRPLLWKNNQLS